MFYNANVFRNGHANPPRIRIIGENTPFCGTKALSVPCGIGASKTEQRRHGAHARVTHTGTHAHTRPRRRAHASCTHAQEPPSALAEPNRGWRHFSARSKCDANASSLGASGMGSVRLRLALRGHAREAEEWGYYKGGRLWLSSIFWEWRSW